MPLLTAVLAALWLGATGASAQESQSPFALPPVPATTTPHVDFASDHFDYSRSSGVIHLEGHAFVKESSWTMHADQVWLYLETKRAHALGNVQLADGTNLAFGDQGDFDYKTHTGDLDDPVAGFSPWRIDGAHVTMEADHRSYFEHAHFTSCNLYPYPHYHFRATSVRVRPRHWLFARNVVFYLGHTPLFYTPFLWKHLDRDIVRVRVQPGYDRLNGSFVKTSTLYDVTPSLRGKAFLDEFGHKGIGYGNELDLKHPGTADGGLYGYSIREKHTGQERWALLGDDFQVLPSSFAFQMRLQAQSDPNFNNDYNRSNSFAVTPQLVNSAAFVRNAKLYTTRLSYSRLDNQDPTGLPRFVKSQEDYPRLDFQSAPLTFGKLPWLNTFTGFADNNYTQGLGYLQRSVQAGWQGKKAIPLFHGVSFEPSMGLSDTYQSRFDDTVVMSTDAARTYLDSYIGRYSGGGDLRFNTIFGLWDVAENYVQRLTPNAFNSDSGSFDHGIETNLLSLTHILRPSRSVYTRFNTGYDWRDFRDHTVGFRDRVQPLSADVTWLARKNWTLLAHDGYQLNQGNQTFAVQSDWGQRGANFFGLGFNNSQSATNLQQSSHYFVSEEFGLLTSSGTWRINTVLRQDLADARGGAHFYSVALYDKELRIEKYWHDFLTMVLLRARPGGVKEASFRIELKLDTKRPNGPSPKSETPWRTWKTED